MEVNEAKEVCESATYNHNSQVRGLAISNGVLYTCTDHYIYAWQDKSPTLLAMFRLPPKAEGNSQRLLQDVCTLPSSWEHFASNHAGTVHIFAPKSYYKITPKYVHCTVSSLFIPSCCTEFGPFAVEDGTLYFYSEERQRILDLPEGDTCTRLKYISGDLFLGMDSGRIYSVLFHRREIAPEVASEMGQAGIPLGESAFCALEASLYAGTLRVFVDGSWPVLDFHPKPLLVSYFGRKLHAPSLGCAEKRQVLSIMSVDSLFILFTRASVLIFNESLHRLGTCPVKGEGISHVERVFMSQDTGMLSELSVLL
ncbi:uncharacterized protein NEMAJ01_0616 [Nematocida major]|uniref:uncharacterized protein n=1 Tax=Nematocida major TaxID=1912982 RepID=UPI002008729A|nr:uncharacterized protein NEMAJ01_0616 [Nematocida major]KAH9385720.1 hypothetical protein NEMAJ01_0616 [Nematocida major]